jgi:1-acyl-sn-glycerol-3-phosphate acyltransferase
MTSVPISVPRAKNRLERAIRAFRGSLFFIIWLPFLSIPAAIVQRLIVWPILTLAPTPARRAQLYGSWLRLHCRFVLFLAHITAGVRVTVEGSIPDEPVVAVMNHQSVLDIPVAVRLFHGASPLFPTRDRYKWKIPFLSPTLRMGRFPFITQRPATVQQDLDTLTEAAGRVARGDNSLLIYAEGHRTRDGQIGRFMRQGPRLILTQAQRPVYLIVADGMWGARTFTDALEALANSRIRVVVDGPYDPPDAEHADAFLDSLRDRMIHILEHMRGTSPA